jgi:hypothetical protein
MPIDQRWLLVRQLSDFLRVLFAADDECSIESSANLWIESYPTPKPRAGRISFGTIAENCSDAFASRQAAANLVDQFVPFARIAESARSQRYRRTRLPFP